jgi:hypothetical protein
MEHRMSDAAMVGAAALFCAILSVAGFIIAATVSPGAVNMGIGCGICAAVFAVGALIVSE